MPDPAEVPSSDPTAAHLAELNAAQREAAGYGLAPASTASGPLLVIAGAGSGKTKTLAHRVAHLAMCGADPRRILLLTFTRRAAAEMTRRARAIAGERLRADGLAWSGTFHSVANRLLRLHGQRLGLDASFTVLDRGDAADMIDLLRHEHWASPSASPRAFPKKGTCLAIYSHTVNAQQRELAEDPGARLPLVRRWEDELEARLRRLRRGEAGAHVLDYDDLLLYWHS